MSPEAGKPEAQTQTGSNEFVQGTEHPTDGVRVFGRGDLPDVADTLLERGVPDTIPIDPETLEVPVDKVPLATPETARPAIVTPEEATKKSRKGLLIGLGSAAAGVGVTVAAFLGLSGNDHEAQNPQPTATSSASPTPQTPETTGTGIELSDIKKQPSTEVINYVANTPILVEGKPNAEGALQAVVTMGNYMNIYRNSGQLGDFVNLTPESIAIGEKIIDNVYGPAEVRNHASNINFVNLAAERESIANAFATYPDLESNRRWQPVEGTTPTIDASNSELWNVDIQNISSGNWDVIGETPERNSDVEGTVQLGTYESQNGLAWYFYNGNTVPTAADIS
jgi:hypothetical protein